MICNLNFYAFYDCSQIFRHNEFVVVTVSIGPGPGVCGSLGQGSVDLWARGLWIFGTRGAMKPWG